MFLVSRARKRSIKAVFIIAICLLLPMALTASEGFAAPQEVLNMAYTDFSPFHYSTPKGKFFGFFHDLMEEAAHRMNVKLTWEQCPWARCQENVREGLSDAMLTVPTEERLRYTVTHDTPMYVKGRHLFTYAGNPRMEEIKSIKSIREIAEKGFSVITYMGNGWFSRAIKPYKIKVYAATAIDNIWRMLALKRGDIVIEWPGGAWSSIHRQKLESKVVQTEAVLKALPFHLMIRKGHPLARRMQEFEQTFLQMRKDGTFQRILQIYHATE